MERQFLIFIAAEHRFPEELFYGNRQKVVVRDSLHSINNWMAVIPSEVEVRNTTSIRRDSNYNIPLLWRMAGIKEANMAFHKFPDRCQSLLAINTSTLNIGFFSTIDHSNLRLQVEEDRWNEVIHYIWLAIQAEKELESKAYLKQRLLVEKPGLRPRQLLSDKQGQVQDFHFQFDLYNVHICEDSSLGKQSYQKGVANVA
jgi:hypothetical protein